MRSATAKRRASFNFASASTNFQSRIVDALPIDAQARQIQFELQELGIDTSGFFIATYDEAAQLITLHEVYEQGRRIPDDERLPGHIHGPRRLGEQAGIIDWLIRHNSDLIKVDDFDVWYAREQIHPVFRQNLRCFMAAPMRRRNKLIGVIGLRGYARPAMFDASHEEMLTALADYMATVVDNAQKLSSALAEARSSNAELMQRIAELEAVSNFQRQISTLDRLENEITNIYGETEKAMRGVGMDTSYMYLALYDEEAHTVSCPLVYERGQRLFAEEMGYDPAYAERPVGARRDLTDWLITHRQPLLFHSAAEIAAWVAQRDDVDKTPTRSRSWLGVPMQHQGKLVGVIGLRHFEEDNKFSARHQAMLETIASQAAIALENSKLYDTQQEELDRFDGLFRAIQTIAAAGVDTQAVLETILQQAVMVTESSIAGIQIIEDGKLNLIASWPTHALERLQKELGSIPLDAPSITARAVRANRYELVQDVALDPDYRPGIEGMGSELAVVLRRGGRAEGEALGVLNVEHAAIEGLDHKDRRLLISLANLAVEVWENARQSDRLQRTNAVALMGAWGADIVHDVNNEVGAIRRALYSLRQRPDLPADVKKRLLEIDGYADSLALPEPLGEAGEGGIVLALRNPPLIDAVIGSAARSLVGRYQHVDLELQLACPDVRVKMHEKWVRQLLHHLVRNAAKAMRPGQQRLQLQVRTQLSGAGDDEMVNVWVQDDGNGVPPHIVKQLFKGPIPRRQQPVEQNGHIDSPEGRGLLLVGYIVEMHGGEVKLEQNAPGVGACFRFTTPVAQMQEDTGEFMALLDSSERRAS
ncbi:MAG: GAF domain-containing protein [Caldilineaceae bacterium]